MKHLPRLLLAAATTLVAASSAHATDYWFDLNGTAAGYDSGSAPTVTTASTYWDLRGVGADDGTDATVDASTFGAADNLYFNLTALSSPYLKDLALQVGSLNFGSTAGTVTFTNSGSASTDSVITLNAANGVTVASTATVVWGVAGRNYSGFLDLATNQTWNIAGTMTFADVTGAVSMTNSGIRGAFSLEKTGAGTLTLNNENTYAGGTTVTAGVLALGANGTLGGGTLTLNGGTLQTTTAGKVVTNAVALSTTASQTSTVDVTNDLTLAGDISGGISTGTLNKTGAGILTLTGSNSFASQVKISEGTLRVSSDTALGANGTILSQSAGTSSVLASADGTALTLNRSLYLNFANGGLTLGDSVGTGDLTFTGNLTRGATSSSRLLDVAGTTTATFNGNLTGTGGSTSATTFTKGGSGTLVIKGTGANEVGYSQYVVTGGTLAVSKLANLGTDSSLGKSSATSATGTLILDGGTLALANGTSASSTNRVVQIGRTTAGGAGGIENNNTSSSNKLTFNNATLTYGTADQTRALTLGGTNTGTNTFATAIGDNGAGAVSVTKSGTGLWILTGANSYSGGTTLNLGTLRVAAGALGSGQLTLNGGTLTGSGGNTTAVTVDNAVLFGGNASISANGGYAGVNLTNTINLGGANRTISVGQTTVTGATFGGIVSNGGITKSGAGELVLNGDNSYAGGTTVNAGTLTVGHANALGTGAATVNTGGTLNVNGQVLGNALTVNGGTLAGGAGSTLNGAVTVGASGVIVASGATLTLNGGMTLATGAITTDGTGLIANAGTLTLGGALDLGHSFDAYAGGSSYKLISGTIAGDFMGISGYDTNVWQSVSFNNLDGTLSFTAVPESSTYGLLGAGALAAVAFVRRRRKQAGKTA